jgi:hypothetical protein
VNDTKKKLLQEIDAKIARKKEMAARAIERNTIEAFVLAFINNVEEINNMGLDATTWGTLYPAAQNSLLGQLQSLDPRCEIEVSWRDKDSEAPQVNGVLIKWSSLHQVKHGVEPELFIDIMTILFKD